jgi:hypothetical protein
MEFQQTLREFEKDYEETMKKSPEAYKVISEFRSTQYQHATSILHRLGMVDAKLAEKMCQAYGGEGELAEVAAQEIEVRGALNALRVERDETERVVGGKLEDLEACLRAQFTEDCKEAAKRARAETTAYFNQIMADMHDEHRRAIARLDANRSDEIVELKKQLRDITERRKKLQDFLRVIITTSVSASLQYLVGTGVSWKP